MDDVQALKLGQSEPQATVTLSGVDKLGERLARRIRAKLEPMVGDKPTVTAQEADMVNFDLWSAMAPTFCSLNIYRLHPLKGSIMVRFESAMVSAIVDRFYGGSGGKLRDDRTEFTPSEERVIARLSNGIMDALVASWGELLNMEYALIGRETDPQALTFAESTDQMVVQNFQVRLSKDEEWPIELMLPMVALRQIEPLLLNGGSDEVRLPDPLWRGRLAQQMQNIRLPARTVLARPSLNLDELLALKPGDVIPVNITRNLPLIVDNRVVAHGTIGEQNGRAAFRVEKMS